MPVGLPGSQHPSHADRRGEQCLCKTHGIDLGGPRGLRCPGLIRVQYRPYQQCHTGILKLPCHNLVVV
jgi:hypothetical protein